MLKTFDLDEYLKKLNVPLPETQRFQNLVDALTYFKSSVGNKEIINFNFERGYLLYCLVAMLKPKNVLEIGTAQGFSTLCMAWAMNDFKIDGNIHTIDYKNHDYEFLHYYKESEQISQKITTRRKLWKEFAEPAWIQKIHIITGYVGQVIDKAELPKIDFFYIDGPQFYSGVKHDFLSSLLISSSNSTFLMDDYIDRPDFGVKKLIDKEIADMFSVDLIKNDRSNLMQTLGITKTNYGLCFFQGRKDELIEHFGLTNIEKHLKNYRRTEKRLKLRDSLNKKIPILKNIRFSKFNILKPRKF